MEAPEEAEVWRWRGEEDESRGTGRQKGTVARTDKLVNAMTMMNPDEVESGHWNMILVNECRTTARCQRKLAMKMAQRYTSFRRSMAVVVPRAGNMHKLNLSK